MAYYRCGSSGKIISFSFAEYEPERYMTMNDDGSISFSIVAVGANVTASFPRITVSTDCKVKATAKTDANGSSSFVIYKNGVAQTSALNTEVAISAGDNFQVSLTHYGSAWTTLNWVVY